MTLFLHHLPNKSKKKVHCKGDNPQLSIGQKNLTEE